MPQTQILQAEAQPRKDRTPFQRYLPEIITITSGKGGVGKTNLAINMGISLSRRKQRVLVLDADLHLGKLDIVLGASPRYTLADLVEGKQPVEKIIMKHPSGIDILPATSGELDLIDADDRMLKILSESFASIQSLYDYLLVDTGAGLSPTVLTMAMGADKVILVVTPEPASVADVYAMIKVISSKSPELPLILVPNRHARLEDGVELHKKLNLITQKFLKTNIYYGGSIVEDNAVRQAVIRQQPFVLEFPNSQATNNLQMVCHRLLKFPAQEFEKRSNIFDRLREKRKEIDSA
ncbi:MAG: MinD/ParA family protein [Candidatus Marinimicrobia bacterium]|nr:MinD/ParA family protein [Candidatus Neomarinimicrobiota bacterium]